MKPGQSDKNGSYAEGKKLHSGCRHGRCCQLAEWPFFLSLSRCCVQVKRPGCFSPISVIACGQWKVDEACIAALPSSGMACQNIDMSMFTIAGQECSGSCSCNVQRLPQNFYSADQLHDDHFGRLMASKASSGAPVIFIDQSHKALVWVGWKAGLAGLTQQQSESI